MARQVELARDRSGVEMGRQVAQDPSLARRDRCHDKVQRERGPRSTPCLVALQYRDPARAVVITDDPEINLAGRVGAEVERKRPDQPREHSEDLVTASEMHHRFPLCVLDWFDVRESHRASVRNRSSGAITHSV